MSSFISHIYSVMCSDSRYLFHMYNAMYQMHLKPDNVFSDILVKLCQIIINVKLEIVRNPTKF